MTITPQQTALMESAAKYSQDVANKDAIAKINTIRTIAGSLGTVAGAGYAFYAKKGFWGYVGFMLLGGIVFGSIGMAITAPMESKLKSK